MIWKSVYSGLNQTGSSGDGERMLNSKYIKGKVVGFVVDSMWGERVKNDAYAQANRKM